MTAPRTRTSGPGRLPVFLVHYGAPDWCRSAVTSVQASRYIEPHVVVIDNGGAPLGELPCDVVTSDDNLGYAGGANLALDIWRQRFPESSFAVVASHDLHVDEDCLSRLYEAAAADDRIGVLGPVLTHAPHSTGGEWRRWHRTQSFDPKVESAGAPVERSWLSGTCLLIRRGTADAVGPFDNSFGSYVEDVDYCLRAWDAGWKVAVVPGACAHGLGSASTRSFDLIARNRLRLLVKRQGPSGGAVAVAEALARIPALAGRALRHRSHRETYLSEVRALLRMTIASPVLVWRLRPGRSS